MWDCLKFIMRYQKGRKGFLVHVKLAMGCLVEGPRVGDGRNQGESGRNKSGKMEREMQGYGDESYVSRLSVNSPV